MGSEEGESPPSSSLSGGASATASASAAAAPSRTMTHAVPGSATKSSSTTPLERAVEASQRGDLEGLERALQEGIEPTAVDADGCSLLHWASINDHSSLVERLLSLGASPDFLGGILHSSPLHWAARVGNLYICAQLVRAGARCDIRDSQGYTPMHLAVQGCFVPIVAYFIKHFDNSADLTDNSGMTPSMWCAYRSFEMFPLRLLVRAGANLEAAEGLQGFTPLHFAAQERNLTAVRELLAGGADIMAKNNQQETPLDIARNTRNSRIIKMMERAGRRNGQLPTSCLSRLKESPRLGRAAEFFLPGAVMGCAALLFHTLHPLLALGAVAALLLFVKFFVVPSNISHSLIPIGITCAEASAVIATWSLSMHWWVPWWAQLVFVFFALSLIATLAKFTLGDPGTIPPSTRPYEEFVEIVHERRLHYFCYTCFVNRPTGSKHCGQCDRCVAYFDHHCPWLNSCITRSNHREFLLFVLSVGMVSALLDAATIAFFVYELREISFVQFATQFPWLLFAASLAAVHVCLMLSLFTVQCTQIAQGITTNQRIKMHARRHGHSHGTSSGEDVEGGVSSPSESRPRHQSNCVFYTKNLLNFCAGN